jgi:hydrogenase expression/formation protein HypE
MAAVNCPVPITPNEKILLGHGSGGRLMHELIVKVFQPIFDSKELNASNDFASLPGSKGRLILTTDAHVVNPLFFPGGDIGKLSICGTVNDIAVSGAIPRYITVGFIVEEGFLIHDLEEIVRSMKSAADEAGVRIVAGDTKVVERGKADGIFITTTGVGWLEENRKIDGTMAREDDAVLISGNIAEHGIAVLMARGDLGLHADIRSDVAPMNHVVEELLQASLNVHVLRDPTRGGLATTLKEIAQQSQVEITIDEKTIPISPPVQTACELLGFDALYVANEGKIIIVLPQGEVQKALHVLERNIYGKNARCIGAVKKTDKPQLLMKTSIGGTRILDMLAGEMLPRIC